MDVVVSDVLEVVGYTVTRLSLADAPRLQSLYERCSDYHLAHEGTPTRPAAGVEELSSLPPGRSANDKFSFGLEQLGGELAGYIELFRNYPAKGDWWIGLLMLDPEVRRQGLGARIFQSARNWAVRHGARSIMLGVLADDGGALAFWMRQGFQEVSRRPYMSQANRAGHTVVVMRHPLPLET